MITKEELASFTGKAKADTYYNLLVTEMANAGINTKYRICAFIAQILHESGNFSATRENMNYSPRRLTEVWPKIFPTIESAQPYNTPQKIANKVYGGRMGNDRLNDGWTYIGRGFIGNTGKDQYQKLTAALKVDLIHKPQLLETPEVAMKAAVWFWTIRSLNLLADELPSDEGKFEKITIRINGGLIGYKDRLDKYRKLLNLYK